MAALYRERMSECWMDEMAGAENAVEDVVEVEADVEVEVEAEVEAEADSVRLVVVGEETGVDSSIAAEPEEEEEAAAVGAEAEVPRAGL